MVFYHLDEHFSDESYKYILKAFERIEQKTCIRFRHISNYIYESQTGTTRYAAILRTNRQQCGSTIGYEESENFVVINEDLCLNPMRPFLQALMNLLGFNHENLRYDRDKFIKIKRKNIRQNYE